MRLAPNRSTVQLPPTPEPNAFGSFRPYPQTNIISFRSVKDCVMCSKSSSTTGSDFPATSTIGSPLFPTPPLPSLYTPLLSWPASPPLYPPAPVASLGTPTASRSPESMKKMDPFRFHHHPLGTGEKLRRSSPFRLVREPVRLFRAGMEGGAEQGLCRVGNWSESGTTCRCSHCGSSGYISAKRGLSRHLQTPISRRRILKLGREWPLSRQKSEETWGWRRRDPGQRHRRRRIRRWCGPSQSGYGYGGGGDV